jgi:hypothetical protein
MENGIESSESDSRLQASQRLSFLLTPGYWDKKIKASVKSLRVRQCPATRAVVQTTCDKTTYSGINIVFKLGRSEQFMLWHVIA